MARVFDSLFQSCGVPLGFSVTDIDHAIRAWASRLGEPAEWSLRLMLAALLGSMVGLEREVRGRQAGFRTNLLVCLGSALAMIVSVAFAHQRWPHEPNVNINIDPARVAYGVMGGIGFLGAGVIVKQRGAVRGLTTAAGLWCVAAMGLACGLGLYMISIVATALVVLALWYLDYLEKRLPKVRYRAVTLRRPWHPGVVQETVHMVRGGPHKLEVKDASWERSGPNLSQVDVRMLIAFANRQEYFRFERELDERQDVQVLASTSDISGEGGK
jgi:putative Mg2+ transporter-C (MgtC) family protein